MRTVFDQCEGRGNLESVGLSSNTVHEVQIK